MSLLFAQFDVHPSPLTLSLSQLFHHLIRCFIDLFPPPAGFGVSTWNQQEKVPGAEVGSHSSACVADQEIIHEQLNNAPSDAREAGTR